MVDESIVETNEAGLKSGNYEVSIRLKPLNQAIQEGALESRDFEEVADFGAGFGNSAQAIQIAMPESNITALEKNDALAKVIVDREILPEDRVKVGDALEFLRDPDNTGRFSLITAFGLGPIRDEGLFQQLVIASNNALRNNGKLLVESDSRTMGVVHEEMRKANVYAFTRQVGLGSIAIFDYDSCKRMASYYKYDWEYQGLLSSK